MLLYCTIFTPQEMASLKQIARVLVLYWRLYPDARDYNTVRITRNRKRDDTDSNLQVRLW